MACPQHDHQAQRQGPSGVAHGIEGADLKRMTSQKMAAAGRREMFKVSHAEERRKAQDKGFTDEWEAEALDSFVQWGMACKADFDKRQS